MQACQAALPVTLVSFSGKMNTEHFTALVWSTSSEANSDHFVIEHKSPSSEKWSAVGNIPAKRESRSLAIYDFLHNQPQSGENLYRLKMVDADQNFAYSRFISIQKNGVTDVFAYPNPFSGKLHFNGSDHVKELYVFDLGGALKVRKKLANSHEVDLSSLMPEKYLIKTKTSDGHLHTQAVVKE